MSNRKKMPRIDPLETNTSVILVLAFSLVVCHGCVDSKVSRFVPATSRSSSESSPGDDSALVAIRYIEDLDSLSVDKATSRILNQLELWLDELDTSERWKLDSHVKSLPKRYSSLVSSESLSRHRFEPFDVLTLREAVWMRYVAQRVVTSQQLDQMAEYWIESTSIKLDDAQTEELRLATILFDWTVRNISLDDPNAKRKSAPQPRSASRDYAWEGLLFGHADAHLKTRIFILLSRQLGIDVVMLANESPDSDLPSGGVAGVMIGPHLFLFDLALGLPILGPHGIATWKQLAEDPDLLRQMDVGPSEEYGTLDSKLEGIVAYVDATPDSLSRRMKLLEESLPGRSRLVLSTSPQAISARLVESGIRVVKIDSSPMEAMFHKQAEAAETVEKQVTADYFADYFAREDSVFNLYPDLMRGRVQHLRGQFDDSENMTGARTYYLKSRIPDREINDPTQSKWMLTEFQEKYGINMNDGPILRNTKGMLIRMKNVASFWLGTIAYGLGDTAVAIDFFQNRTIAPDPTGFWATAARYNLARCYETIGLRDQDPMAIDKARALYGDDSQSPQSHGNRLRARWLEAMK